MSFVFVSLDEVPAADKVFGYVVDCWSYECEGDVVPGHAAVVFFVELVVFPIVVLGLLFAARGIDGLPVLNLLEV